MQLPVIQPRPTDATPPVFQTIGIVGLGLIGGSVALAARELWPSALIVGVDRPDVLEAAMRRHAVDVGGPDLEMLGGADLVVLAAPVRQNLALLPQLVPVLKPSAVITDVGSTKRDIVRVAESLPASVAFVAGHPVAGAAVGGFQNARADLFKSRPWLFTAVPGTSDDAVERLTSFAVALGATPGVMTLDEHDRVFAFVSHLPQLAVSALMAVAGNAVGADGLGLSGRGLLDSTRLASSPADIWRDVAAVNADQLGPALDALIEVLQAMRHDLQGGAALDTVFADAQRWREELVARTTL